MSDKNYTIMEVAEICKVQPNTAIKWFNSGRLHGYKKPGTTLIQIPKSSLKSFMKEYGMLPLEEVKGMKVYLLFEYGYDWYELENFMEISVDPAKLEERVEDERLEGKNYPLTYIEEEHGSYADKDIPHYYIIEEQV